MLVWVHQDLNADSLRKYLHVEQLQSHHILVSVPGLSPDLTVKNNSKDSLHHPTAREAGKLCMDKKN